MPKTTPNNEKAVKPLTPKQSKKLEELTRKNVELEAENAILEHRNHHLEKGNKKAGEEIDDLKKTNEELRKDFHMCDTERKMCVQNYIKLDEETEELKSKNTLEMVKSFKTGEYFYKQGQKNPNFLPLLSMLVLGMVSGVALLITLI